MLTAGSGLQFAAVIEKYDRILRRAPSARPAHNSRGYTRSAAGDILPPVAQPVVARIVLNAGCRINWIA